MFVARKGFASVLVPRLDKRGDEGTIVDEHRSFHRVPFGVAAWPHVGAGAEIGGTGGALPGVL
jgi:hypothetical protein